MTKYVIERMDMAVKGGWHPIHEAAPSERTHEVTDLQLKKEYKFRIRALNKLGSSEPVTYPKVVLAKDPWGEKGQKSFKFFMFRSRRNLLCYIKERVAGLEED